MAHVEDFDAPGSVDGAVAAKERAEHVEWGPGARVGVRVRGGLFHRLMRLLVTSVLIHYLLWFPAVLAVFGIVAALMWRSGFSAWACAAPFAVCAAAYARTCTDGSETRLGREWPSFRLASFWTYCHEYMNLVVVRTAALDASKLYVFGLHPHGILLLSRLGVYGGVFETLFPGVRVRALGASPIFYWPGSREVSLWLGAVDAARKTAHRVLHAGLSIIVYPGGSREIFTTGYDAKHRTTTLVLKEVKGFVRLAIQHGAPLVPVVIYNERDAYKDVAMPDWLRHWCLKRLRMPMALFYGAYGTLLPHPIQLGIVFGAAMDVPHMADAPDKPGVDAAADAAVDATHARYVEALTKLWHEHKARFGYDAAEQLRIV